MLLTKIRAVNMGTMVGINDSLTLAGGKALTVMKLKELGSKAECKAWRLYDTGEGGNIQLNWVDEMIPDNQPPTKVHLSIEEFWQSLLPDGFNINSMDPDGNCLFRSLLDRLYHDDGQAHDFTHHQITNYIPRYSDKFKDFLLLQDNHEDISDLDSYVHKWNKTADGGATLNYMLQPSFIV
jgi:hypothetical protein